MKRFYAAITTIMLICSLSATASATDFLELSNRKIAGIWTYGDNLDMAYIHLDQPSEHQQCQSNRFIVDYTTPSGKALYAAFLMAYLRNETVSVMLDGDTCHVYGLAHGNVQVTWN